MALSFEVRSFGEMLYLGGTFAHAFPEVLLLHQPVHIDVLGVASVASARSMERLVLHRVHRYGWTATNLPALRNLAHLSEMIAYTDDYLRSIADRVEEGEPLDLAEREELFGNLEVIAYVVEKAGRYCVQMVRAPATTLARKLAFFVEIAARPDRRFPLQRIQSRVASALQDIVHIMHLTPPMV